MNEPWDPPSGDDAGPNARERPPFSAPDSILLVPLLPDPPAGALLRWLAGELQTRLETVVRIAPPLEDDAAWRTPDQGQLSSGALIDALMERFPVEDDPAARWILAVATSDLAGGGRDYVFGEATLGGGWAVVSTARLGAAGDPRFRSRLLREAMHELGHLAGRRHCRERVCLMAPAATVEDVDAAGMESCRRCSSREGA